MSEKERCYSSNVDPQTKVMFNGHEHSAAVSHSCKFEKGHKEPIDATGKTMCECLCGRTWKKWLNA